MTKDEALDFLMPFGRYFGWPLKAIMQKDSRYLHRLAAAGVVRRDVREALALLGFKNLKRKRGKAPENELSAAQRWAMR